MKRIELFIQQDMLLIDQPTLSSNKYMYKQNQPVEVYISPSTNIYLKFNNPLSKMFQSKPKKQKDNPQQFKYANELQNLMQLQEIQEFKQYKMQNFGIPKSGLAYKPPLLISCEHIRQIQIVESQMLTKVNQPDAQIDKAIFIDFKEGDKQKQILLLPQSFNHQTGDNVHFIFENIHIRQLIFAAATATLRSGVMLLKSLECDRVNLSLSPHMSTLEKSGSPIDEYLINQIKPKTKEEEDVVHGFCLKHLGQDVFWRRIGFQSSKPQSDFRAAGLFGMLAVVYTAHIFPNFLINGSYCQDLKTVEQILQYVQSQKQDYNYPIAISVITIAHELMINQQVQDIIQSNTALFNVLINDYVYDYIRTLQNAKKISDQIQQLHNEKKVPILIAPMLLDTNNQGEKLDTSETTIFQYINSLNQVSSLLNEEQSDLDRVFHEMTLFNPLQSQLIPFSPFNVDGQQFCSINPQLCGSFYKLTAYLAIELNRRLSSYEKGMQYMNFPGQFAVLMQDFKQVLLQQDVLTVEDLVLRIQAAW